MKRTTALAATTALVTSLILPGAAALAQTLALEEIVVTARKIEENLMEVPVAITAFSAADLDSADMSTLDDIQLFTPSFFFSNQQGGSGRNDRSSNSLTFRGLFLGSNTGIKAGGLMFIDGAPIIGSQAPSVVDMERVEILKGPQAAYFGRSTFVGAINFVTKDPADEFGGRVSAEYSRFGSNETNLVLEGPIVPGKMNMRVSGRHWAKGGDYTNAANPTVKFGERETNSLSTSIVFTPTDNLKIKAFVNYFEDNDGPPAQAALKDESYNCTLGGRGGYYCGTLPSVDEFGLDLVSGDYIIGAQLQDTLFNPPASWTVFDTSFNNHGGTRRAAFQADLRIDYDHDSGYAFSSLTAFHEDKQQTILDLNYRDFHDIKNPLGFLGAPKLPWFNTTLLTQGKQNDISQELRITSPQDGSFRWTAGFNYLDAHSPGGTVYGNLIFGPFFTGSIVERNVETPAIFGAGYFDITEELTLGVEARYQWDKISEQTLVGGGGVPLPNAPLLEATFKSFSPRVTLDYNYGENSTAYALFSRGFRPGGFNSLLINESAATIAAINAVVSGAGVTYAEEKIDNYELGLKSSWLDGRARTTVALYYMEWLNGQNQSLIPVSSGGVNNLYSITINNGVAHLQGVEFEGQFQATENLTLSGSLGYNDTKYVDSTPAFSCSQCNEITGSVDATGNELPYSPKVSWSLSASYDDELNADWDFFTRADWAHQGALWADQANIAKSSAYDVVNLRAGIRQDDVSIELFLNNALDHGEFTQARQGIDLKTFGPFAPNGNEIRVSLPDRRSWGVRASYNF
ncbi:MAG: TonB-dependent receptor [Rhodospirillales bacterium]|jgi:iron complex outermembrane receptor protein